MQILLSQGGNIVALYAFHISHTISKSRYSFVQGVFWKGARTLLDASLTSQAPTPRHKVFARGMVLKMYNDGHDHED